MGPFDMNYEEVANGAILNKKKPGSAPDAQGISAPPSISSAPVIAAPQAINSIATPSQGMSFGNGQKPTIFENGGLPADVVQRGIDTMRSQMATPAAAQVNQAPAQTASGPTVSDGAGGVYTPESGTKIPNPITAVSNFFSDSARAARGDKSYEQIRAERSAAAVPSSPSAVAPVVGAQATVPLQTDPFASGSDKFPMGIADNKFITGHNGAMPDSSGGGFTQGKTSYNVNPSSQDGITKVTAQGKNPLYTNIKPELAVSGLKDQMIGGDSQEGIARMARANATRQEMIDAQPVGGGNILPDQNAIDNAEKTARWRQDDLVYQARQGNQAAIASIINANSAAATEASRANTEAGKTAVTARGQDVQAKSEAARIAGNPQEQQLKQAQTQGILAQTDSAKMLADMQKKALAGDPQAMASYQAITGKKATPATDRYMTVTGGEEVGPDGMTKVKKPSGVFDAQTGQFVQMGGGQQAGQAQAPASALDYLKKNPGQSAAFKAKYGYLPEGF